MTTIGYLKPTTADSMGDLVGKIQTLDFDLEIHLSINTQSTGDKAPSHKIFAKSRSGNEFEVGAAWTKKILTAEQYGKEFLSLTLDDPSFPRALNVAAFRNADDKSLDITWRRRQDKQGQSDS